MNLEHLEQLPQILRLKSDSDAFCKFNKHLPEKQIRNIVRITNVIQRCMSEEKCMNDSETMFMDPHYATQHKKEFCAMMDFVMKNIDLPESGYAFKKRLRDYSISIDDFRVLEQLFDEEEMYAWLKKIWKASNFRKKGKTSFLKLLGVVFGTVLIMTATSLTSSQDQGGLSIKDYFEQQALQQEEEYQQQQLQQQEKEQLTIHTTHHDLPHTAQPLLVCHKRIQDPDKYPVDKQGAPLEVNMAVRYLPFILWQPAQSFQSNTYHTNRVHSEDVVSIATFLTNIPKIPKGKSGRFTLKYDLLNTHASVTELETNWYVNAYENGDIATKSPKEGDQIGCFSSSMRMQLSSGFRPKLAAITDPVLYWNKNALFPVSMFYQLNFLTQLFILLRNNGFVENDLNLDIKGNELQNIWIENSLQWFENQQLSYPILDELLCEMYQPI